MKNISRMVKGVIALFTAFIVFGLVEVAPAASLELTQKQKEDYYKQYVEIVAEVAAENPGVNISLVPIDEFKPEDWVKPEEFKKYVIDRANATIIVEPQKLDGITPYSGVGATKIATIKIGSTTRSISVTGSFETQYSDIHKRQLFSGVRSITSKVASEGGTWTQTGYEASLIDGGRTYVIIVGGKYTQSGVTTTHLIDVEFYCGAYGSVG
jgi:hypothetical protein